MILRHLGSDRKKHQEDKAEGATGSSNGSAAAAAAAGLDGIWVCVCVCVCQGNGLASWLIHLLWQMDVGVPTRNFLCFSFVK